MRDSTNLVFCLIYYIKEFKLSIWKKLLYCEIQLSISFIGVTIEFFSFCYYSTRNQPIDNSHGVNQLEGENFQGKIT